MFVCLFVCYVRLFCLFVMFVCYVRLLCSFVMFVCFVRLFCSFVLFVVFCFIFAQLNVFAERDQMSIAIFNIYFLKGFNKLFKENEMKKVKTFLKKRIFFEVIQTG